MISIRIFSCLVSYAIAILTDDNEDNIFSLLTNLIVVFVSAGEIAAKGDAAARVVTARLALWPIRRVMGVEVAPSGHASLQVVKLSSVTISSFE